jgi:O-antigen/teichoic acid export membrane protein
VTAALSFALLPVLVRYAGTEAYGVYLLVGSISGYFGLLDFGIGSALTRFAAEARGRDDTRGVERAVAVAFLYYAAVGAVAATLLLGLVPFATRFLTFDPALEETARRLLVLGAAGALVLWPTNTFRTAAEAQQRFHLSAGVSAAFQVAGLLAGTAALAAGLGVEMLLAANIAAALAANVAISLALRRGPAAVRLRLGAADRATFRTMRQFGGYMFVGSLASFAIFQLDHLVVASFLSLGAVTVYNVAWTLQGAVKMIDNLVAGPPWVAGAEMEGRDDLAGQQRLLLRGTRYIACFFVPALVILAIFADALVVTWMGPSFREAVLPARILVLGWIVVSLWETGAGLATAKGAVRSFAALSLVHAVLNVGLSLALAGPFGVVGVALGTAIPFVLMAPLMWRVVLRTVRLRPTDVATAVASAALPPALAGGVTALLLTLAVPPSSLRATIVEMAMAYGAAALCAWVLSLTADDRGLFRHVARRLLPLPDL